MEMTTKALPLVTKMKMGDMETPIMIRPMLSLDFKNLELPSGEVLATGLATIDEFGPAFYIMMDDKQLDDLAHSLTNLAKTLRNLNSKKPKIHVVD